MNSRQKVLLVRAIGLIMVSRALYAAIRPSALMRGFVGVDWTFFIPVIAFWMAVAVSGIGVLMRRAWARGLARIVLVTYAVALITFAALAYVFLRSDIANSDVVPSVIAALFENSYFLLSSVSRISIVVVFALALEMIFRDHRLDEVFVDANA